MVENLPKIFEKYREIADADSNEQLWKAIEEIEHEFNVNEYDPMSRKHALQFGLSLINAERIKCAPGRNSYLRNEIEEKAGIDLAMQQHYYNRYNRCAAAIVALEEMIDEEAKHE
jgi:hypothetical protein